MGCWGQSVTPFFVNKINHLRKTVCGRLVHLKSRRGYFTHFSSTSFFMAMKRCIVVERNFRSPWKGLRELTIRIASTEDLEIDFISSEGWKRLKISESCTP